MYRREVRFMRRFFNTVYVLGIIAEIVTRLPYERQRARTPMTVERVTTIERLLLSLLFLGIAIIPAVFIFTPWLRRANYQVSPSAQRRAGILGVALMTSALWVFWRAHHDLGQNWSPSLQIRHDHTLVTHGIYQRVRHPMYLSQWLWSVAQVLLLQNWIAGWAGLLTFLPLYLVRVPREEQMLLDQFGDAYREYMERSGRVLPRC
jgi:protein-S-isoprenylcysteine O-methyltransferase Ste14